MSKDHPPPSAPQPSPEVIHCPLGITFEFSMEEDEEGFAQQLSQEERDARYARQLQREEEEGLCPRSPLSITIVKSSEEQEREKQNERQMQQEQELDLFQSQSTNDTSKADNYARSSRTNTAVSGFTYEPSIEMIASRDSDEECAKRMEQTWADEELAKRLQEQEEYDDEPVMMTDEEMARAIQEQEQTAAMITANRPLRSSDSQRLAIQIARENRQNRPKRCAIGRVIYSGMLLIIIGGAVIGVAMFGRPIWDRLRGTSDDLPPYFNNDWGKGNGSAQGNFSSWNNKGKGLKLKIRNALNPKWDKFFVQAVNDWNKSNALSLTIEIGEEDPQCEKVRGILKVCNDFYGMKGWTGLNEVYFEGSNIAASVAKMNESYLSKSGTTDAERQYVMCHELGHGFGLPHRDENAANPDLGSCLDYTYRYKNNIMPDSEVDFANLENLYGVLENKNRRLRSFNQDQESMNQVRDAKIEKVDSNREWHYEKGRLLHQSDHHEIYLTDLGDGKRILTTLLLAR